MGARKSHAGRASGGFRIRQEECKTFSWKVRSRPDQTGRFVYVNGDDSYFPAEETEDTERLSHLPKVKLARQEAQVGLQVSALVGRREARDKALRCSEVPRPLEG